MTDTLDKVGAEDWKFGKRDLKGLVRIDDSSIRGY